MHFDKVVLQNREPNTDVLWAKPDGDKIGLFIYNNGKWVPLSGACPCEDNSNSSNSSSGGSELEVLKIYGTYAYSNETSSFVYNSVGIEGTIESIETILNKDFIAKVILNVADPVGGNAACVTYATPVILVANPYGYVYLSFSDPNGNVLQDRIDLSYSDGVIHLKASEYHETTMEDPITGNTVNLIGKSGGGPK